MLTVGSLFAGYGGIELALSSVLDVRPAWFVEFDKARPRCSPPLAGRPQLRRRDDRRLVHGSARGHHHRRITLPGPTSHAGKRAGMTEGTRSNLWVQMREAINVIRPRVLFAVPADARTPVRAITACNESPRRVAHSLPLAIRASWDDFLWDAYGIGAAA